MKRTYRLISQILALCMVFTLFVTGAPAESASPVFSIEEQFTTRDLKQNAAFLQERLVGFVVTNLQFHVSTFLALEGSGGHEESRWI